MTGGIIWESFKHPSNAFLPSLIISNDQITGERINVTSWKTPSDPAIGNFSGSVERLRVPEIFVWNKTKPYWRSGPWNGQIFISLPNNLLYIAYLDGFSVTREDSGSLVKITFAMPNSSYFGTIVVSSDGKIVYTAWMNRIQVGRCSGLVLGLGLNLVLLRLQEDGSIKRGLLVHFSIARFPRAPLLEDTCSLKPIHYPRIAERLNQDMSKQLLFPRSKGNILAVALNGLLHTAYWEDLWPSAGGNYISSPIQERQVHPPSGGTIACLTTD
ncbi:cysteine-rich receptor-like protein kinase [Trifolium medium]|uniref:Cysteine-rich receptor-like protein kinase n=1 Tax=Trifolium medium TaxID=97028 RepID=A0A392N362_9FABA|nr:cysteine-rich receptor-like protein kinase [Trifolium medium]